MEVGCNGLQHFLSLILVIHFLRLLFVHLLMVSFYLCCCSISFDFFLSVCFLSVSCHLTWPQKFTSLFFVFHRLSFHFPVLWNVRFDFSYFHKYNLFYCISMFLCNSPGRLIKTEFLMKYSLPYKTDNEADMTK